MFISCNPATEEVLFEQAAQSVAQLNETIDRLKSAYLIWSQLEVTTRARRLAQLAECLLQDRQALATLISSEVGRRPPECWAEIDKSIELIRYYVQCSPPCLSPQAVNTQASFSQVAFEPLGLILGVMPWNYPIWQVLRFAIPALIAGNVCLIKPAPNVPQCTQRLLDYFAQCNLDIFALAWAAETEVEFLIEQAQAVAFTGSTTTGRIIARLAGHSLKKTVLELGGSNPFIVLADADVAAAAVDAAHSRFRDAGQSCNAAKRIILVPAIADEFIERFFNEAAALRYGPPNEATTTLAPLARADLRTLLHEQVIDALKSHADLLLGGQPAAGPGFFYPATVLDRVTSTCRVYHEEVFGPVASILRADSDEHAIYLANDTPFGLSAAIYSQNKEYALTLARQLAVGSVYINRHTSSDLHLPFGGVKSSGYGRELSSFGLYEFVNIKSYWVR